MDIPKNPIAGATAASQGAPGPEVSQSYTIPAGMTAEAAALRSRELIGDPDFAARLMKGGMDSKEGRELDALQRHTLNQAQPTPAAPINENQEALKGLGAPSEPYDLSNVRIPDGGFLRLDEATNKLAADELLPQARSLDLSQSDVAMIASTVANPVSYEQCESTLRRLWPGEEFERGLADFRTALANQPKARALVEAYPETLGNSPMLISSIVAAYRRRQGRSR
jgi:hypothetical protein